MMTAQRSIFWQAILSGFLFLLLFSVAAVFIVTLIGFFTDFMVDAQENQWIFNLLIAIAVFAAALRSAYKVKKRGFLVGLLLGGVYALLLYQLGVVFFAGTVALALPYGKILICLFAGTVGGIVGVNL